MNIKKAKTPDDFKYMEQLELKYYSEEHVTPHKEAYLLHLSNPETGFVLEDGGRIAAFTDILPVKQGVYEGILQGVFNDKFLTADDLVDMEALREGDSINLLLSCVVVDDDYRETDALKMLLTAHLGYYRGFAERGIQIGSVVTSNVTKDGERFSERMGFERIGESEHHTAIYRIGFHQLIENVKKMKSKLEIKLLQYETDLLDPIFCSDVNVLNALIADDFTEYGQSGAVYDRSTAIRFLSAAKWRNIEIRDFSIRCLSSHTAVVHYTAVHKHLTEKKSLRTSIWVKEEGVWKLHFHQGTEMKAEGDD